MTLITGQIRDTAGVGLDGSLLVSSLGYQVSGSNVIVESPRSFSITGGNISIDLEANRFVNLKFEASDNGITYLDFNFVVPNVDTDISQLIDTPINYDLLDTSVIRLADYLMTNPVYVAELQSSMRYRGQYSGASLYFKNDVVSYDGGSYVYVNPNPQSGVLPSDPAYWFQLAERGASGTGTAGNDTPYDAATWDGQTDAPSRNAIRDLVEGSLVTHLEVAGLAPLSNPVFTNPASNTPLLTSNDTSLITSEWFWDNLSSVLPLGQSSAVLTGTPSATTPIAGSNNGSIATTAWIWDALANIRTTSSPDANLLGSPTTTTPSVGSNDSRIANTAWVTTHVDNDIAAHVALSDPHNQYLLKDDSGWIEITSFGTGFSNFDGGYVPARYRKVGQTVNVQGYIKRSTGTTNVVPFSLPAGFYLSTNIRFSSACYFNGGSGLRYGTYYATLVSQGSIFINGIIDGNSRVGLDDLNLSISWMIIELSFLLD